MNNFELIKEMIKKEKWVNDLSEVARECGLTTTLYYTAIKKDSISDLTKSELRIIEGLVVRLNDRRKRIENLNASMA